MPGREPHRVLERVGRRSGSVFSRVPPIAGPSRVEWMQTIIQAPLAASWRTTTCSPSHRRAAPRTRARLYSPRSACAKPLEPRVERLVGDGEREPGVTGAARAEALAGRERDAVLVEQPLDREAVGQAQPDEERALAAGLERAERRDDAVAARLVERAPLGDRLLRAASARRSPARWSGDEDARADVLLQPRHAGDELGVADDEAEPPAGHPVALREREELDADVARARLGEEAPRARPSKTRSP